MADTIRVRVLRAFPYAADGIRAVPLAAGADADIDARFVPGLAGEGFVEIFGEPLRLTEAERAALPPLAPLPPGVLVEMALGEGPPADTPAPAAQDAPPKAARAAKAAAAGK